MNATHGWRLPPDYRENLSQQTWEGDRAGSYWHEHRTGLSHAYQFDVYLRARQIALAIGAQSILDVGSGPGIKAARLLCGSIAEVVLVDQPTTAPLVAERCPSAQFVAANLEDVSLGLGRTFDVIICADVIEHLIDPRPCLMFIRRHSAPHTRIVLSTPERDYARGVGCRACDKPEHVREWTGPEFVAMLADHGFQVTRHHLCPTLRPEPHREDTMQLWLEAFAPRTLGHGSGGPDPLRSCQVCECRVNAVAAAA
jgi:SAM-dependent methyltransferase